VKKSAFIFAIFYLLSSIGYGVELHYCLGQITDVNIAWLDTSCACDDEHKKVAPPCCEEKEFFIQIEQDHQASKTQSIAAVNLPFLALVNTVLLSHNEGVTKHVALPEPNGPPLNIPLFERFCARIIYS